MIPQLAEAVQACSDNPHEYEELLIEIYEVIRPVSYRLQEEGIPLGEKTNALLEKATKLTAPAEEEDEGA